MWLCFFFSLPRPFFYFSLISHEGFRPVHSYDGGQRITDGCFLFFLFFFHTEIGVHPFVMMATQISFYIIVVIAIHLFLVDHFVHRYIHVVVSVDCCTIFI